MAYKFRALFIFFLAFAVVTAVIVGILPFILESSIFNSATSKAKPQSDNTDIWGEVPGQLGSKLKHTFSFFDYNTLQDKKVSLSNTSVAFDEKVKFKDLEYDAKTDQIAFKSTKEYAKMNTTNDDEKTKLPSLGLFETLETLSNPALYQKGMSAAVYLQKLFLSKEELILKLFTVYAQKNIFYDEKRTKEALLSGLDAEIQNKIWNDETYGLKSAKGIYQWAKLIANDANIDNAKWMKKTLGLQIGDIYNLVGGNSFLDKYLKYFNKYLASELECADLTQCGNEIVYMQLIDRSPSKLLGVDNLLSLSQLTDLTPISLDQSLEMDIYFQNLQTKPAESYDEVKLSTKQFSLIFESDVAISDANSAINILNMNKTADLYQAYTLYSIKSSSQLNFITNYIFESLPSTFLYQSFTDSDKTYSITPTAKTFSSFAQVFVDKTYGPIKTNSVNIYNFLLSKLTYNSLSAAFKGKEDEICATILQPALNNGRKVLKICSTEEFNMKKLDSIKIWVKAYKCVMGESEVCDLSALEALKKSASISDADILNIYSEDSLGYYILQAEQVLQENYKCEGHCTEEFLVKRQYAGSFITQNPPKDTELKQTTTLAEWSAELLKEPVELYHIEKTMGFDVKEEDNYFLYSIYNSTEHLFDNRDAMNNKKILEEVFILLENGVENSKIYESTKISNVKSYVDMLNKIFKKHLFKFETDDLFTEYKAESVLFGNNDEDKTFVDILSSGVYFDNFKPKMPSTTGFNLYHTSNDNEQFDKFTIQTAQNDPTQILRRIIQMNGVEVMNIKKKDYSPKTDSFVDINAPLYNLAPLTKEQWMSDGYQFGADNLNTIYYFDELSARVFEFNYKEKKNVDGHKCHLYIMNEANVTQELKEEGTTLENISFGTASTRFNKPFVVSSANNNFTYTIDGVSVDKESNFFCVDFFSNMVLESNLTLVYSLYTNKMSKLSSLIEDDTTYPMILYNRYYKVDKDSYDTLFSSVPLYNAWWYVIVIGGCLLIAVFLGLAVLFFVKHSKEPAEASSIEDNISNQALIAPEKV